MGDSRHVKIEKSRWAYLIIQNGSPIVSAVRRFDFFLNSIFLRPVYLRDVLHRSSCQIFGEWSYCNRDIAISRIFTVKRKNSYRSADPCRLLGLYDALWTRHHHHRENGCSPQNGLYIRDINVLYDFINIYNTGVNTKLYCGSRCLGDLLCNRTVLLDTIRDAILTCARKPILLSISVFSLYSSCSPLLVFRTVDKSYSWRSLISFRIASLFMSYRLL